MKLVHTLVCLLALSVGQARAAVDLACHDKVESAEQSCVDRNEIRAKGDIRSSPLYTRNADGVTKTNFMLLVDCARSRYKMQSKAGFSVKGDLATAAPATRAEFAWLCEAPRTKPDKRLSPF